MTASELLDTSWDVIESDGTVCVFYFRDKGLLAYDSNDNYYENGRWSVGKDGRVHIDTNDHYADYTGTIKGDKISGDAWNVNGLKWTWKGTRRK